MNTSAIVILTLKHGEIASVVACKNVFRYLVETVKKFKNAKNTKFFIFSDWHETGMIKYFLINFHYKNIHLL